MSPEEDDESPLASGAFGEQSGEFSSGTPEISPNEIKRGKELGKGSFGKVYAGMCRAQVRPAVPFFLFAHTHLFAEMRNQPVAIKVMNEAPNKLVDEKGLKKFRDEIAVHHRLFHPNIVLLMGACTSGDKMMIVQELMHKDLEVHCAF